MKEVQTKVNAAMEVTEPGATNSHLQKMARAVPQETEELEGQQWKGLKPRCRTSSSVAIAPDRSVGLYRCHVSSLNPARRARVADPNPPRKECEDRVRVIPGHRGPVNASRSTGNKGQVSGREVTRVVPTAEAKTADLPLQTGVIPEAEEGAGGRGKI